jgi:hypothetical protein
MKKTCFPADKMRPAAGEPLRIVLVGISGGGGGGGGGGGEVIHWHVKHFPDVSNARKRGRGFPGTWVFYAMARPHGGGKFIQHEEEEEEEEEMKRGGKGNMSKLEFVAAILKMIDFDEKGIFKYSVCVLLTEVVCYLSYFRRSHHLPRSYEFGATCSTVILVPSLMIFHQNL